MKLIELLEDRSAPLYHWLSVDKLLSIINTDTMFANWSHDLSSLGLGMKKGNSFSRNPNFVFAYQYPIQLTVDQNIIQQTNRIIPLDGERIHGITRQTNGEKDLMGDTITNDMVNHYKDRNKKNTFLRVVGQEMSEEFVIHDIKDVHRCIQRVFIHSTPNGLYGEELVSFCERVKAYCRKYNIRFDIDTRTRNLIQDTIKRRDHYRAQR